MGLPDLGVCGLPLRLVLSYRKTGFYNNTANRVNIMKKAMLILLTVIAGVVLSVGVFMLINGSLEAFPTSEQTEKARICGMCIAVVGALTEAVAVIALCKMKRK